ncbi:hypothetical protein ACFSJU_00525 [Paradesertivirga mongoliensis]|uniref:Uncharacterized protein n=1 Tax=Paradesertivirga mongoliensis TaxID=2100740 RepID=A0ABW4ZFS0_9SPHI|nr:hypothetical protein [Pedobacter mongoliensis]
MAFLKGDFEFTGSMGNVTGYKLPGIKDTVIRTKGGASKKKIYKADNFKLTRQNFTEFSGCGKMGGAIRRSMLPMVPMADYNFTPVLNSFSKTIQLLDSESLRGERNIYLSRHKHLLNGFSLNRNIAFESIIRHPLKARIDAHAGKADVQLPELMPGVNLVLNRQAPMFRFVINLGSVADALYTSRGYLIENIEGCCTYSGWYHATQLFSATELSVELNNFSAQPDRTLILSLGIQMGTPITDAVINPLKYGGCAKIIAIG